MDGSKLVAEPRTAAFELAGAGLVVTDTAGSILRANQVYAQFLGVSPTELIGTPFTDAFPEEMRELAQRTLRGALVPDALPMPSQWTLRRSDGSDMRILLTVRPTEMPTGRYGAVLTLIDISALTATESRLFSAMEEQRLILENAQVGILFTRAQRIMRYNAAFAALFSCSPSALIGEPWSVLFNPHERLPAGLPSGTSYHAEHRLQRRDGREIWCMVEARAFGSDDNAQIIWTFRDTTIEREALSALEAARSELELRVAERTRDLEEKNRELQTQIAERRQIEERLRAHGEKLAFHRNQLLALAERNAPDFAGALRDVAEVSMRTLGLDRVSFWRVLPEQGRVQCELTLRADHSQDPPDTPQSFGAEAHIARFASASGHHINQDASTQPGSDTVIREYMRPLGIASMLDTPVWLAGQVIGSISFEVMNPRTWSAEDIDFAAGICTLIALAQEAEQRRDAEAKLRRLAHFDALTSLPNRHLLQDRLKQALAFAQRHRSRVALMFIDLDRFKTINDSLGHLVGDRLLMEVSHRLTASVRAEDSVARLGGDEFVVVLQDLRNANHAATIAQNLLNAIEPPYSIDGRDLHVSGSIGIALYPDDGEDIETLMRNADTAMYHVKESGRNGFQFFTAEMNAHANARLTLENDLRLALKRDELLLHYQPQYDIASGRIDAIEALLRWNHPRQGLVLPDAFIPLAEESGLIQQLGEWTLNRVCTQVRAWTKAGLEPVPVAVNLSARQFRHPAFAAALAATLAEHRMAAGMIEVEITESALVKDLEATLESFRALKAMGIRLAIDDFGIGYSSLAYLKRFPVDKLKIDRSFIRDISADPDDRAIVSAIISMSKNLELRVVAEGVETAEQLAFLRERGCDGAQGFLFCPPMEADAVHHRMAEIVQSRRNAR